MFYNTLQIFAEQELDEFLQAKLQRLKAQIEGEKDDYILNVNEEEYIDHLVNQYETENLELNFEEVSVSTQEKSIPAERFPSFVSFNISPGRSYTKDIIKYHIPFDGDKTLLRCLPNPRSHWTIEVTIEGDCLCFEIINFYSEASRIKNEAESNINHIKHQLNYVQRQVNAYNKSLKNQARNFFDARKQHLLKKNDLLASLGVPIKRRDDFPRTFAIPTPQTRRNMRISKPSVAEKGYKPEPTLPATIYEDILQMMHDIGRQFERMPSTYANKREEELRDHFLLFLEPRFEGSATGETFNKSGKTDILLRHDNSNVFIAECKFWKGGKSFLETITQLLRYLTWRDSKAAVVIFVRNQDFSSVIETVEAVTPDHPNQLGFVNKKDNTPFLR
ncbi:MAG: hypothetical protein KDE56_13400 [Anaerolineales bacterium]|nr:hypothetical protein [Anaerolineales bacterium]